MPDMTTDGRCGVIETRQPNGSGESTHDYRDREDGMRYRKKPVEIKAIRWTGDNYEGLSTWVGDHLKPLDPPSQNGTLKLFVKANMTWLPITVGEWVAKDRHGFYAIKDDVFLESYEAID